ncbi:GFA family protein [Planctobacterium marinum]|uniref:Aldehyde-activating protein n=1 Tax=Planctobacterium marinum TaxID=1631968 RepID=A0AA48KTM0_9ALTE|nr:aldehyde-activating protein [Planctobacterium marinum]
MSELMLSGGCFCGKVTFNVHGTPNASYFCHCQQCRKLTGSAHASNMQIKPDAVDFTQGKDWINEFSCPTGRAFSNAFCRNCGSGLPFMGKSGEWMYVPIGSLDNPPVDLIDYNIFWDDKANWYEAGIKAKRCSQFPSEE